MYMPERGVCMIPTVFHKSVYMYIERSNYNPDTSSPGEVATSVWVRILLEKIFVLDFKERSLVLLINNKKVSFDFNSFGPLLFNL